MTSLLNIIAASRRRASFDPDFAAYLALGISNGSSMSSANQAVVNAFFVGAKADGFFSALKASCLLCAWDSLAGALTPIVGTAPTNNNFVSGDYSRSTGLTGNGSTKWLNSNRSGQTDPQNNFHMGVYVTDKGTITNGAYIANNNNRITNNALTATAFRCRSSSTSSVSSAASGFVGCRRIQSTDYDRRVAGASSNVTNTSANTDTTALSLFSFAGSLLFHDCAISFYSIGESLDLSLLDSRLATLMSSLT